MTSQPNQPDRPSSPTARTAAGTRTGRTGRLVGAAGLALLGAATLGTLTAGSPAALAADARPAASEAATTSSTSELLSPSRKEAKPARLVASWLRMWNGDYSQADTLIAPSFRLHAAMMDGGDGSAVDSPQALVRWIASTRVAVPDLAFTVEVGPLVDGDHIVVRWQARGTYAGGVPGARAPVGTAVDFTGTDILRVERGQLAEYWVNSDTLALLTQLQVGGAA